MTKDKGWHGQLNLSYKYQRHQTLVERQYTQAPLKIQQPFYPEGKEICHSVILHTAGGMVGGDRLSQTIDLQTNAKALVTTAAAGKIYGGHPQKSEQNWVLNLAEDTVLEWLPQENIIFNNAFYQQSLTVNLAPNSSLFLWEINRFGRTARGEKFTQGQWRSQTQIYHQGYPLWIDRQNLGGGELIDLPNGLGGYTLTGSFIYLGQPISSEIITQIREVWQDFEPWGQAGVTQCLGEGVIGRCLSHSTSELRRRFTQVWHLLRQVYLQRSGIYPRVWLI